jgi:hypothetical protein
MNYAVDALHLHSFEHAEASALKVFVPRLLNHIRSASCKVITVLRYEFLNMTSCSLAFRYQRLEETKNLQPSSSGRIFIFAAILRVGAAMFPLSMKLQQQVSVCKRWKMLQANYAERDGHLIVLYSSISNTFVVSFYALFLMLMRRCCLHQTSGSKTRFRFLKT